MSWPALGGAFAVVLGAVIALAVLWLLFSVFVKATAYAMLGRRVAKGCGGIPNALAACDAADTARRVTMLASGSLPRDAELIARVRRLAAESLAEGDQDDDRPNLNGSKPH